MTRCDVVTPFHIAGAHTALENTHTYTQNMSALFVVVVVVVVLCVLCSNDRMTSAKTIPRNFSSSNKSSGGIHRYDNVKKKS